MPHPLEQLRYVARGWSAGDDLPATEVAAVLADLAERSPNMLLQACRRMIEYFPSSGVAWWLSARALASPAPSEAIWEAAVELEEDPTAEQLAAALPAGAVVAVSPLSTWVSSALRRRRDVQAAKKLAPAGILLVTVTAAGPSAVLATARAVSVADAAARAGKKVWAVAPRGAVLPAELWEHLLPMALSGDETVVIEAAALDAVVGPEGEAPPAVALARPGCPAVAELRGWRA